MIILLPSKVKSLRQIFKFKKVNFHFVLKSYAMHGTHICTTCWSQLV